MKELIKSAKTIELSWEKFMEDMYKYGNNCGGKIPILLVEMNKSSKLKSGHKILFAPVGSGCKYCAATIK